MAHRDQNEVQTTDYDVWGKPWTTEDIRGSSRQWTLAGDSGLLNHMQGFAQQMISQTHNMQRDVEALLQECKATDSRVHNVVNDFLMLSNTQFVESRVYDEEIQEKPSDKKVEQPDKKNDEKEAELVAKVSLALSLGLSAVPRGAQILNDAPEVEEAQEYEFDDADKIWQINDPYCDRPLPYVIGTEAFLRDDYVGLKAVVKEADVKDQNKGVTDVPRVDSQQSLQSQPEHATSISNQSPHSTDNNSENSEEEPDIFDEKAISNEDSQSNQSAASVDFASELKSKLGITSDHLKKELPKRNSDSNSSDNENARHSIRSESSTTTSSHSKIQSDTANQSEYADNIFGTVPEDASPFGKNGLFSSDRGLFDDADSEDDLFSTAQNKSIAKKPIVANKEHPVPVKKPEIDVPQKPTPIFKEQSLFGDDDDDESDLFSTLTPKKNIAKVDSVNKQSSLFDDEEPSLFANDPILKQVDVKHQANLETQTKKKIMAGARPMIGGMGDSPMVIPKLEKSTKPSMVESDIANENDEFDWLDSDPVKPEHQPSKSSAIQNKNKDTNTKEFQPKEQPRDLFMGKGEPLVDDLFNSNPVKGKVSSLFDDDESDDLFAPKMTISSSALPSNKGSLFDDINNQSNIGDVKRMQSESKNIKPASKTVTTPVKKASLFDDDETDDLFSSAKTMETKSDIRPRSKSLFEDEDVLFGPQTDSPEVDLFGGASVVTTKMKESSPKKHKEPTTVSNIIEDSKGEDPLQTMVNKTSEKPIETTAKTEDAIDKDSVQSSQATPEPITESPRKKLPGGIAVLGGLMLPGIKASPAMPRKAGNSPKSVSPQETKATQPNLETNTINTTQPEDIPVVITFEEPPTLETLHSTNKERIKIQVKRRLPTRKGRQEAIRKSAIDIYREKRRAETMSEPVVSSKSAPTSPLSPDHSPHLAAKLTAASPSTEEEDLFSVGGTTPGSVTKDIDGLFASSRILAESPTKEATDLFSSRRDNEPVGKITESKKTTVPAAKTNKPALLFEDDEDIFSEAPKSKQKDQPTIGFPNTADDDDDIFKDAVTTQPRPSRAPSTAKATKKIVSEKKPIFEDPLSVNKK